jgi:hypothetical protein
MLHARCLALAALVLAACPAGENGGLRADAALPDASVQPQRPDASPAEPDADLADLADAAPLDAAQPDAAAPDAGPVQGPACPAWVSDVDTISPPNSAVMATVESGFLVLGTVGDGEGFCGTAINQAPCERIKIFQRSLRGDFDVTLEVSVIDGAGDFSGPSLFLSLDHSFAAFYKTSIYGSGDGQSGKLSVASRVGGVQEQEVKPVSTTAATLRARRVGGQLTLSGSAGGKTLSKVVDGVTADLVVGVSLSDGETVEPIVAAFPSFTVFGGGGGVVSDDFGCDRVIASEGGE